MRSQWSKVVVSPICDNPPPRGMVCLPEHVDSDTWSTESVTLEWKQSMMSLPHDRTTVHNVVSCIALDYINKESHHKV